MAKNARFILSDNLRRILTAINAAGLKTSAWAEQKHLQRKQVERTRDASVGCSVDFLDDLARALGCEPWQLLVPDLDLSRPPKIALSPDDIAKIEEVQRGAAELVKRFTIGEGDQ